MAKVLITLITVIALAFGAPELGCDLGQHRCSIDVTDVDRLPRHRIIPADIDITLKCFRPSAQWFYQDKFQLKAFKLQLERAQSGQSGNYGCLDSQNKWFNISLTIGHPEPAVGNDIASFAKVGTEEDLVFRLLNRSRTVQLQRPLPESVQRTAGGLFLLNCAPSDPDDAGVNITWLHNDTQLPGGRGRIKLKRWTLTVGQLQPEDAGSYRCRLCAGQDCVLSTPTRLEVISRTHTVPVLRPGYPGNTSVALDDHVKFQCPLEDSPLEPKITWLHFEDNVANIEALLQQLRDPAQLLDKDRIMTTLRDEPQILGLGTVQLVDAGWYICVAENQVGRTVGAAYLEVHETGATTTVRTTTSSTTTTQIPQSSGTTTVADTDEDADDAAGDAAAVEGPPVFKKQLYRLQHVVSGKTVTLGCPVDRKANITWSKDKGPLERTVGTYMQKKWKLIFDDPTTEDAGIYTCQVCNAWGCIHFDFSVKITNRIRSPPILVVPQNQTVLVNSSVALECFVISDPETNVNWTRVVPKNRSLTGVDAVDAVEFVKLNAILKGNLLTLELHNVTHDQEGWYTCVAGSSLGRSNSSVYLWVVDRLPHMELSALLHAHPLGITVAGIMIVVLLLLGSAFIVCMLRRMRRDKLLKHRIETVHQWTKKVIIYRPAGDEGSACSAGDLQMPVIRIEKQRTTFSSSGSDGRGVDPAQGFNEYEFPLDSNWEIPRQQLSLGSILGEGAFGRVVMAEAEGLPRSPLVAETIVAVKMVKEEHTDTDMASLVREMEVMKMIGKHINIINLLGCCSQGGPLWVIVEYAPHGNLKDFLKQNRPGAPPRRSDSDGYLDDKPLMPVQQLGEKELTKFAFQIARGMEYLASRRKLPKKISLKQKHLIESFQTTRPSLSASDVAKYHKTYSRFTNKEKSSREFVAKRATLA